MTQPSGTTEPEAEEGRRLLLVDDDSSVRESMVKFFRRRGFIAESTSERHEAEALLRNRRYDALIVDLQLTADHGREGYEVLSFARRVCPGVKTILLTAVRTTSTDRQGRESGADVVLDKPQALADLTRTVTRLLEGRS